MAPGFIKSTNCFVHFISADGGACFEPVGGVKLAASHALSLNEFSQEDVPIRESFLNDECICRMVVHRITKCSGLSGSLSCMVVARCLYYLPQFAVRVRQARMRFLNVHGMELSAEVRFCKTES